MKMIPTQYQQKIVVWRLQTNGIIVFVQTCKTMLSDDLARPGPGRQPLDHPAPHRKHTGKPQHPYIYIYICVLADNPLTTPHHTENIPENISTHIYIYVCWPTIP